MLFEAKQKIVFIGDSITDCGRRDEAAPYGNGYVSLVRGLLLARYPERQLRIVNQGSGGDTTRNLAARWKRDVIAERPDWLAVMIGINDVWRTYDSNGIGAVGLEEYTATLRDLLKQTRATTSARLILAEPYMIEPDQNRPMRRQMDTYAAAVRQVADEYDAILVRTQAAFDAALACTTPKDWADDQIHPNAPGHAIIGLAFLKAIAFDI
jgi:lysophospholipase L1-like esterase